MRGSEGSFLQTEEEFDLIERGNGSMASTQRVLEDGGQSADLRGTDDLLRLVRGGFSSLKLGFFVNRMAKIENTIFPEFVSNFGIKNFRDERTS